MSYQNPSVDHRYLAGAGIRSLAHPGVVAGVGAGGEMKTCSNCGETKPPSDFYRSGRAADGLQGWCAACHRDYRREWRKGNERAKQQERGYSFANKNRNRKRRRNWRREHPETREADMRWCRDNPEKRAAIALRSRLNNLEKHAARGKVKTAIAKGILVRGWCEVCGKRPVHAHHDDYSKPLEVRWLCQYHHQQEHWGHLD